MGQQDDIIPFQDHSGWRIDHGRSWLRHRTEGRRRGSILAQAMLRWVRWACGQARERATHEGSLLRAELRGAERRCEQAVGAAAEAERGTAELLEQAAPLHTSAHPMHTSAHTSAHRCTHSCTLCTQLHASAHSSPDTTAVGTSDTVGTSARAITRARPDPKPQP